MCTCMTHHSPLCHSGVCFFFILTSVFVYLRLRAGRSWREGAGTDGWATPPDLHGAAPFQWKHEGFPGLLQSRTPCRGRGGEDGGGSPGPGPEADQLPLWTQESLENVFAPAWRPLRRPACASVPRGAAEVVAAARLLLRRIGAQVALRWRTPTDRIWDCLLSFFLFLCWISPLLQRAVLFYFLFCISLLNVD